MTSHVARLYALVAGVVTFSVAWAAVAAHPWKPRPVQDPRVAAIAAREQRLHRESLRVKAVVDARWASYRTALASRRQAIASAQARAQRTQLAAAARPSVRVVTLPPLVVTRTS